MIADVLTDSFRISVFLDACISNKSGLNLSVNRLTVDSVIWSSLTGN